MSACLRDQTIAALEYFKQVLATTGDPRVRALLLKEIPEIEAVIRQTERPSLRPIRYVRPRKSMRRISA